MRGGVIVHAIDRDDANSTQYRHTNMFVPRHKTKEANGKCDKCNGEKKGDEERETTYPMDVLAECSCIA